MLTQKTGDATENATDAIFEAAITRLSKAISSSKFGSETNDRLCLGLKLLKTWRAEKTDDVEKLRMYDCIVAGTISFAMAIESEKYDEFTTPLNSSQLRSAIDANPENNGKINRVLRGRFYAGEVGFDRKYTADVIVAIGKKVVEEKTIPLFPDVALFHEQGVSISDLMSLHNASPKLNDETSSPRPKH